MPHSSQLNIQFSQKHFFSWGRGSALVSAAASRKDDSGFGPGSDTSVFDTFLRHVLSAPVHVVSGSFPFPPAYAHESCELATLSCLSVKVLLCTSTIDLSKDVPCLRLMIAGTASVLATPVFAEEAQRAGLLWHACSTKQ